MRPVMAGDIFALAHELLQWPRSERARTCSRLLMEADWADRYRKRFGALHPHWGNGSLMGRVGIDGGGLRASPAFQTQEFCACVVIVLENLNDWRGYKRACAKRSDILKSITKPGISP